MFLGIPPFYQLEEEIRYLILSAADPPEHRQLGYYPAFLKTLWLTLP